MWWYLFFIILPWCVSSKEELCSLPPESYALAKEKHPETAFALEEIEKLGIATWYTDRMNTWRQLPSKLVSHCPSTSRLSIVVYGLPNKDCDARESHGGSNHNNKDYQEFINHLQQSIGDRKVLYVLEPDAVALVADNGCGQALGYEDNLKYAIRTLSINPNADIYVDVGYWMLSNERQLHSISTIVQNLYHTAPFKGITINTSNYRSNSELSKLCHTFRMIQGNDPFHCTIDTSRNYNGPSNQNEWCNYKQAGIGQLPTDQTNDSSIDYYIWIKAPGESDGQCISGRTSDAFQGPEAGKFSLEYFKTIWNHGVFVKEMNMPMIDGTIHVARTTQPPLTVIPTNSERAYQEEIRSMNDSSRMADNDIRSFNTQDVPYPIAQNANTTPVHVAETQSQQGSAVSSGIIVLACLIPVALVALIVVVVLHRRQRRFEIKTPLDSDICVIHASSPSDIFVL